MLFLTYNHKFTCLSPVELIYFSTAHSGLENQLILEKNLSSLDIV